MKQEITLLITIILIMVLLAAYAYVYLLSGDKKTYEKIVKSFYSFRKKLLIFLLIMAVPITYLTLIDYPISNQKTTIKDAQIINAKGFQWYWQIDQTTIIANLPVEFRISSGDVTHGFGIYDESLTLLTQTQAMPGYVNKLIYTFTDPGEYKVMCMEYCGLAHHDMVISLNVIPQGAQ